MARRTPKDIIKSITEITDSRPDTVSLWSKLSQSFGGQDEFAREAKSVYDSCEPGSAQQVRMMSMFIDLCKTASAYADKSNPADELNEEELTGALMHLMKEQGRNGKG